MIGLLFWCFVALWLIGARWLARRITTGMQRGAARIAAMGGLIVLFIVLPLSDEIVGGVQLRALCRQNAMPTVDVERTRGRKVRVRTDPANKDVDGTWVRILYSHSSYRDIETDVELFSSHRYVANGGWLIRVLSSDSGVAPLTFESTCDTTPSMDLGLRLVK